MPAYGSLREKGRERTKDRDKERRGGGGGGGKDGGNKERDYRDRELERENRRKAREREERELDYLRRWDELPTFFGKGKEKEKEKERERERERERQKAKEKERERRERYKARERMKEREQRERERGRNQSKKEQDTRSRSRSRSTTQRDRSVSRERERHRPDKDKGKAKAKDPETMSTSTPTPTPTQSSRHRNTPDPTSKSYIPYTRDEAEAAGMKILCAKFKSAAAWDREQREREARRAILRARMEGRLAAAALAAAGGGDGKEGGPAMAASASTTTFGSTSTSTLTLTGGGIGGFGLGGEPEKGRERRYTSTGPSLAAALATIAPPATVAEASSNLEGVQGHNKSGVEMDKPQLPSEHPPPPVAYIPGLRKGSLPTLGLGLGKLVGGGGSSSVGTDPMVGSPLTTNIIPGSSASGTGGGKFSIGLFGGGKDKDKGQDKEEDDAARAIRKREERERKEREKRQKAIDKELKKERKRREGAAGDEEDEVGGSTLSWRLGGAGKKRGKGSVPTPTPDKEELERLKSLEQMEPITFAPMPVRKQVDLEVDDDGEDEEEVGDRAGFSKSMVSIPTIADSATLHDPDYMEVLPPSLPSLPAQATTMMTTPPKPKLHVSTSCIGADLDAHSDSDSCSVDISSPVFAHSTDSEGDDTVAKVGYRYGGYQPKEKGREKEKVKTKEVADADKEGKTETTEPAPPTTPVRRKEVDRGEWIILDMGNDHGVLSLLFEREWY